LAHEAVARRYARALFEIGQEEGALERFDAALGRVADAIEASGDLRAVLPNPVFEGATRKRILREVASRLGTDPLVTNFLCLLVDKGKLRLLGDIARDFRALVDRAAGRVEAQLLAAAALDPATTTRVEAELAKATGKQVRLTTKVDPSLIGGVVARVGGLVLDASLKAQLDALRQRLARDPGVLGR
jgi:F-type H+-transporting ATPase subunit delta